MDVGEKFMDKRRKPKAKGKNEHLVNEPAENTNFTSAADRITPYEPEELNLRKD